MSVLEIGCGGGEVTQILAELVGSSGAVVAIDRNLDTLTIAKSRLYEHGIEHVQFIPLDIAGDLSSLEQLHFESFDVLAGRRVLMYLPKPHEVLSSSRYTEHQTFNQQIAIADVVVGNKSDLYQDADRSALEVFVSEKGAPHAKLLITEQGRLEPSWLNGPTLAARASLHDYHQTEDPLPSITELPIPESGYLKVENQGEGFRSIGWRFTPYRVFDRSKLVSFFSELKVERLKAVFITESGIFGYNLTPDSLTEMALDDCAESRVEIIAPDIDTTWEKQLLDCIAPN